MANRNLFIYLFAIALIFTTTNLSAQTDPDKKEEFENWSFRVSPFFWYVGINGKIKSPPQPSQLPETSPTFEIDIPFEELSNSLKFFLMISTEYNKDRFVVLLSNTTLILEGEAVTPL